MKVSLWMLLVFISNVASADDICMKCQTDWWLEDMSEPVGTERDLYLCFNPDAKEITKTSLTGENFKFSKHINQEGLDYYYWESEPYKNMRFGELTVTIEYTDIVHRIHASHNDKSGKTFLAYRGGCQESKQIFSPD